MPTRSISPSDTRDLEGPGTVLSLNARRLFTLLLAVMGALTVASVGVQLSYHLLGHGGLLGANRMFDMTQEANVPTWYTSMLLLSCSVVLSLLWANSRARDDGSARWWAWFALLFASASLDEAAGIHEAIGFALGETVFGYLVPGALALILIGLAARHFMATLPRSTRVFLLAGTALWAFGAVALEGVEAAFWPGDHRPRLGLSLLGTAQDVFELLGIIVLLRALVEHAGRSGARVTLRAHPPGS